VLVDARKGLVEQSRRHAILATLLRVPHLVLAVNKMDLVDYRQDIYDKVHEEFTDFAAKLDATDLVVIPLSALHGDNVVTRSGRTPHREPDVDRLRLNEIGSVLYGAVKIGAAVLVVGGTTYGGRSCRIHRG
jgi:predicted membrane GTPase involved in stress response